MKIRLLSMIAALALSPAAMADEVWSSDFGDFIYEKDFEDGWASISFPDTEGRGHAFVEGLAGNYDQRGGVFYGYWTEDPLSSGGCAMEIVDHNGLKTNIWGRFMLVFHTNAFPSGFTAVRGNCFDEPDDAATVTPVVAGGIDDYIQEPPPHASDDVHLEQE